MDLPIFISYKWNYVICRLSCVRFFNWTVFSTWCSIHQYFFITENTLLLVQTTFFHSRTDKHLGYSHLLAVIYNAINVCMITCVAMSLFLSGIFKSGVTGTYDNFMFNFLRKRVICTILQSGQQCLRVSVSSRLCQHLLLTCVFSVAVLVRVRWVILFCFAVSSLMTDGTEQTFI